MPQLLFGLLLGITAGLLDESEEPAEEIPPEVLAWLEAAEDDDPDKAGAAAAELAIYQMERAGITREPDPFDWKSPSKEKIRGGVRAVRKSTQKPEHAIANMCAHTKGWLRAKNWRELPAPETDWLDQRMIGIVQRSEDPVVRTMLLEGLGASDSEVARDAIVAATGDAHPGVRKSACYLVESLARTSFGLGGSTGIASEIDVVQKRGRIIRNMYHWDKTLGAGWGRVEGGLQTRLKVDDSEFTAEEPIPVSMLVRNVSDQPIELPQKALHPVHHVRVLFSEQRREENPRSPDKQPEAISLEWRKKTLSKDAAPLAGQQPGRKLAPGEDDNLADFNLLDYYDLSMPGYYEIFTNETQGLPPPYSNRVTIHVMPSDK